MSIITDDAAAMVLALLRYGTCTPPPPPKSPAPRRRRDCPGSRHRMRLWVPTGHPVVRRLEDLAEVAVMVAEYEKD